MRPSNLHGNITQSECARRLSKRWWSAECGLPASLDFLPHRGNLCDPEATVPHLSPTTLTTDEQRLILRVTAGMKPVERFQAGLRRVA